MHALTCILLLKKKINVNYHLFPLHNNNNLRLKLHAVQKKQLWLKSRQYTVQCLGQWPHTTGAISETSIKKRKTWRYINWQC